jgi:hypothetical protein
MFQKLILFIALITACAFSRGNTGYTGSGFGFHVGPVFPDEYAVDVGFCGGAYGVIDLGLGEAGEFHYCPGVDAWFGATEYGHDHYDIYHDYYDNTIGTVSINFADFMYMFPTRPARPYFGIGPAVQLNYYKTTHTYWVGSTNTGYWEDVEESHDWDTEVGINLMGGVDIQTGAGGGIGFEVRGCLGGYDVLKLLFCFRF